MPYLNFFNAFLMQDQKNTNGIYCSFTFWLCSSTFPRGTTTAKDLTRETHLKVLQPRMLSGPLQGRFLSLLANYSLPNEF